MNELYKDDDKLLLYIRGQLPEEERVRIDERLKEEPELQKALDDLLLAQAVIWQEGRKQESEKLKELYRAQQQPAQTRPMFMRYAVAAAIVILAGLAVIFMLQKPSDPQSLFADAYTLPPAPEQLAVVNADSLRREAFTSYNSKDFQSAQDQLENLLQIEGVEKPDELLFYLGISQLEQEDTNGAIASFSQMTKNLEATQWYTALAYLKAGDTEKLKQKLQEITADPEHFYVQKARDLLDEL